MGRLSPQPGQAPLPLARNTGFSFSVSFVLNVFLALTITTTQAALFTPTPSPNLDLRPLGRIALVGNFDAASLYSYKPTIKDGHAGFNGSLKQSLIAPLPDGSLFPISSADADILTMCPLKDKDGAVTSVVVGGNFTSLGGVESNGMAIFNYNDIHVSAVPGLSGSVNALYCDSDSNTVYVGGEFRNAESTNALTWSPDSGLSNLPFGGFNGPVTSIVPSKDGRVVFGGSFDGLGNTTSPDKKNQQIVNLFTAEISVGSGSTAGGFSDPRNIICPTAGQSGPGKTWLLTDNAPGYWRAKLHFGFRPTKLRVRNAVMDGRGTKTFRFTALPDGGILNMTYIDPESGDKVPCDARCPLSNDPKLATRDFYFVNSVGMSSFQLEISEWYGQGAGFTGIELFQDDIYAYAFDDLNEPTCAGIPYPSTSTKSGNWNVQSSQESSSDYLITKIDASTDTTTSVTIHPDIKQSGNYSVTIFTPGCIQDGTCATRGTANVTASFKSSDHTPIVTSISQTNNFDKYDQIYVGHVDASSSKFRPSVTITPRHDQGVIDFVASRIRFQLISSTGGLNGLYEYDPKATTVDTNFTRSAINKAGTELEPEATVNSLVWDKDTLFIAGSFTNASTSNIVSLLDGKASPLAQDGLNFAVKTMQLLDGLLYVGGNFSKTANEKSDNLGGVAAYSISDKSWHALGAGVNGPVTSLVLFPTNVTAGKTETTIAVNGLFTEINAAGGRPAIPANGFAVWVPSEKKWLQELNIDHMAYVGQLTTSIQVGQETLLAGNLASGGIASHGAVNLVDNNKLGLRALPVNIELDQGNGPRRNAKRTLANGSSNGVITGLFDMTGGRNLSMLAGHFTAKTSDNSIVNNLVFLNGAQNDVVTGPGPGIDKNSTFLSLAVNKDMLLAGGKISGKVADANIKGLVVYDLKNEHRYASSQPSPLDGDNVEVRAIAPRPGTGDIFVGGVFQSAGALPCPSVCNLEIQNNQWSRPGTSLRGDVTVLLWADNDQLLVAGNLTVERNTTMLAKYDAKEQQWSTITGKNSESLSGEVRALGLARSDGSKFWIAGKSTDGNSFLVHYDGTEFRSAGNLFGESTLIEGLQVLPLTKNHDKTDLLDENQSLLITGKLQLPDFGYVSGALFDGNTIEPFILSSMSDGRPGSISGIFSENTINVAGHRKQKPRGIVVLISFCIALGCVFFLVLFGILLNRYRRYKQGYVTAPQGTDRKPDLNRVPPEYLLESLRHRTPGTRI
ncbi:hypothetical protein MGYG_06144 [Nannizzia gypsea CBS 118893]|uniref:Cellular morphogenesis protein n=1 Tax=Arthroderma gypseum (strain ATCC MYA-4604 / CBS 118893) TaxID=535722 RepID=E4V0L2_ARTGP|nr:hypothetical protein MGYG_06144 [Nannizzia gypsea CBS 118893]EFR03149.1 hypothetical protein MGYG_06144 [Nannizzia gypsea CBS 118893]